MPRKSRLSAQQFKILFEQILQQYKQSIDLTPIKANASEFFGYRMHDPHRPDGLPALHPEAMSLKKAMLNNDKVYKNLTLYFSKHPPKIGNPALTVNHRFNGQNLYNKYKEIYEDGRAECIIEEPYSTAYANYIGYESLEKFRDALPAGTRLPGIPNEVTYDAYYYSYFHHDVRTFHLHIDYSREPFSVRQDGFHDHSKEPEYVGNGMLINHKIHAVLRNKEHDEMKIILSTGHDPEKQVAMLCTIQAVSSYDNYPHAMSCEALIVRTDHSLTTAEELRIKRFLFLHRYNFKIASNSISLDSLEAKRRDVDMIDYLAGHYYRVWRFDEDYRLVQSVLYINEYYKATCYTSQFQKEILKEQICLLEINESEVLGSQTLCISAHPKKGSFMISYIMFDLPFRDKSKALALGGIICLTGHGHPAVRSISMMKDERLDSNFDRTLLKDFPFEQAKKEIEQDPRLKPLYEKLVEEERRNTKPEHLRKFFDEQQVNSPTNK